VTRSLILQTATRALQPVLLLYSIFLLVSGHNEPGGGFVAGLVASAAVALHALAYDVAAARRLALVEPRTLVAGGLLLALASGAWSLMQGQPFMTGVWREVRVPPIGTAELGTPLFFDVGVYLVVIGVTLLLVLSIAEE
jgi:multicomponent Na+:H+ antiporter subunit B